MDMSGVVRDRGKHACNAVDLVDDHAARLPGPQNRLRARSVGDRRLQSGPGASITGIDFDRPVPTVASDHMRERRFA